MKKIAVILSGCGVFDGSEIHEAVLTMLAIDKAGAKYQCFAPNIKQNHVINHVDGTKMNEERNVLIESARIARGDIKSVSELDVSNYDALIFPGGFGAAKNLCDFAINGDDCVINSEIEELILDFSLAKKPIGALCISPVLLARVIEGAVVTIGNDLGIAESIEKMGGKHKSKNKCEIFHDEGNNIVTSACYMLESSISDVAVGASMVVDKIISLS